MKALEDRSVEIRKEQREKMKEKVEQWNQKRKEEGLGIIEDSDYNTIYEQMSAQERYEDSKDILAPIENSFKQLEVFLDHQGMFLYRQFTFLHFY